MMLLKELSRNFVEEIFDTYRYKKRELYPKDIKRAVIMKFPDSGLVGDNKNESGVVMANRSK